jgi:eukaryotic-like serine/threonine-protein kinase
VNGIADYEFVHLLGEGSHGSFWLARCPARLGRAEPYVAIKTFAHRADDADFQRLTSELQRYMQVGSPQLAELYDVGLQNDTLYYAGRYFPDGSLAQPARPFTRASVLAAITDAALAAHALHEAGIAHRSIKPGNIYIDGDHAKLGDIGLLQVLNPGQTITGLDHVGSIEYLAPELIQGQPASRATDLWALGATMHRVLTARSIYPDVPQGSLLQALRYLVSQRPVLSDRLRDDEREMIELTLGADPAARPATALEFAHGVGAIAEALAQAEPA